MAALLAGCALFTAERSSGVDAARVAQVELYEYAWGAEEEHVDVARIPRSSSNTEVITELVGMFHEMPTTPLGSVNHEDVDGAPTLGVRYLLDDGEQVEMTRIFLGHQDVVVIWPDGQATRSTWGAPDLIDYYGPFGEVSQVGASEAPAAVLAG